MHSIVSVVGLSGHLALQALAGGSSAVSPEAQTVHKAATEIIRAAERSQALFGNKVSALSDLAALKAEYSEPGWDGSDGAATDPLSVFWTEQFIRALPEGISLPEFAPEPDGSISLDWILSRTRMFSLSIGPSSRLSYAWLDGANRGHGVAGFNGQRIPPPILDSLDWIVGARDAALRVA